MTVKRTFLAGITAALLLGAGAPTASAQAPGVPVQDPGLPAPDPALAPDPLPTVTAKLGGSVRVTGANGLSGGPARIQLSLAGRPDGYRYGIVYALQPDATAAKLKAALRSPRQSALGKLVARFEGSVGVLRRQTRSFSVFLAPGTTYAVVDATEGSRRRWRFKTFETEFAISSAAFPTPAATFRMTDYAFRGPSVLPRKGVVLFQNTGRRIHSAGAYRLKASATSARVAAHLRAGRFKNFQRLTTGRSIDVAGLVSPGNQIFTEPPFRIPGRYVLLSDAVSNGRPQYRRGMFSFFRVR